ncbi:probable G-protein coupled receptor B0563.6 [Watersipora subatra]|uniref:probable G-protein coupled receptor B0563.6 n=1 Tax=Watersipora subatra TaxID=2589382 RepID=UPI00355BC5A1
MEAARYENINFTVIENGSTTDVMNDDSGASIETAYITGTISCIITLLGVIFNVLNIYVLVSLVRKRKNPPNTYYLLIAMGVADFLVMFFYGWFTYSVYTRKPPLDFNDLTDEHSDYYFLMLYLWYFPVNPCSLASNWIIVATTVFRFLAVVFPLKASNLCSLNRMKLAIILIAVFSLLLNSPTWTTLHTYTRYDDRVRVTETPMYNKLSAYYVTYHVIEIYLPFIINSTLVAFLIVTLNSSTITMSKAIQDETAVARNKERRKISIMLIAIVLWFLLCNLPVVVYNIMELAKSSDLVEIQKTQLYQDFARIKDLGPLLNHAGNIIFYCLCNNTYRRTFINTILCRKRNPMTASQHTTMTHVNSRHEYVTRLREMREDESKCDRKGTPVESSPFMKKDYKKMDESSADLISEEL